VGVLDWQEGSAVGFEVYKDRSGAWRCRRRARNGELVASSGEAFSSKQSAIRSVDTVRRVAAESEGHKEIEESASEH